jgi:hypothetical protein
MLSLIATTVSIVLTFGTAALIDHYKKNAAKKEMVMMVISNIDNTIAFIERVDSSIIECRRLQHEVALHPESYDSLVFSFPSAVSWISENYLETTEKIFSTSIETFNTIGDVNFVNDVSSFYLTRQQFKETVLDEIRKEIEDGKLVQSLKSLLNINFPEYALSVGALLEGMKKMRDKCMQRMNVSEEDLSEFNERNKSVEVSSDDDSNMSQIIEEYSVYSTDLNQAKEKLNY